VKPQSVEGRILFIFSLVATSLSCQVVWFNWQELTSMVVGAYIGFAQLGIMLYFDSPCTDPWLAGVTTLLAIGYCALTSIAFHANNSGAFYGLYGGMVAFLTTLLKRVYGMKPTSPAAQVSGIQPNPTIQPDPKPIVDPTKGA